MNTSADILEHKIFLTNARSDLTFEEKKEVEMRRERKRYSLWQMIKHGNPLFNLLCVTSILFPRHARCTLLYMNIVLIWFWCAVIYNNSKDPLQIPEFDKQASNMAAEELWIPFMAPVGTMILMYIFAGFFRISDHRIKQVTDYDKFQEMMKELQKETILRFLMAYFIIFSVFASVFWYVIKFSATFR